MDAVTPGFSFRLRRDRPRLPPQRKRFFQRAKTPTTSTRRPTSLSFGRLVYGVRLRSGERSFEPFLFLTRYGCTDPAKCVGCCISSPRLRRCCDLWRRYEPPSKFTRRHLISSRSRGSRDVVGATVS